MAAHTQLSPEQIRDLIRDVPDFPKPGVLFKDITPLLADPAGVPSVTSILAARYRAQEIDYIVAIESRGFFFGMALAIELGIGLIPIRKAGKLPHETVSERYELEYGHDTIEMHSDLLTSASRVVLVDDVLATGGTAAAAARLIESLGAEIAEITFLMELDFLKGRSLLGKRPVYSIVNY